MLKGIERPKTAENEGQSDNDDSESVDEDRKRFEEMAAGIDEYYKKQKEYSVAVDRNIEKKDRKRKALLE
jgi:hypothetical protein